MFDIEDLKHAMSQADELTQTLEKIATLLNKEFGGREDKTMAVAALGTFYKTILMGWEKRGAETGKEKVEQFDAFVTALSHIYFARYSDDAEKGVLDSSSPLPGSFMN